MLPLLAVFGSISTCPLLYILISVRRRHINDAINPFHVWSSSFIGCIMMPKTNDLVPRLVSIVVVSVRLNVAVFIVTFVTLSDSRVLCSDYVVSNT